MAGSNYGYNHGYKVGSSSSHGSNHGYKVGSSSSHGSNHGYKTGSSSSHGSNHGSNHGSKSGSSSGHSYKSSHPDSSRQAQFCSTSKTIYGNICNNWEYNQNSLTRGLRMTGNRCAVITTKYQSARSQRPFCYTGSSKHGTRRRENCSCNTLPRY